MRNQMMTAAILASATGFGAGCGQAEIMDTGTLGRTTSIERPLAVRERGRDPGLDQVGAVNPPPREYYDAVFASVLVNVEYDRYALTDLAGAPVVWLSFDGATVSKGFELGDSYQVCDAVAKVPASKLDTAERRAIVTAVQEQFDRVGIAARFTDEKPRSMGHTTVHVGGTYADLGCPDDTKAGATGIAPFDVGDASKADVAFVFETTILDMEGATSQDVARHVQMQVGRAFGVQDVATLQIVEGADARAARDGGAGVDEEDDAGLTRDDAVAFHIAAAGGPGDSVSVPGLGAVPSALVNLPGLSQMATIAQLVRELDGQSLVDIAALLPLVQQLLPEGIAGLRLPGFDKVLTVVGLVGSMASQPALQSGLPAVADGAAVTAGPVGVAAVGAAPGLAQVGQLLGSNNAALASIGALLASGGFPDLNAAIAAAQAFIDLLVGQAPTPPAQQPPAQPSQPNAPANLSGLPNLAALLGLASGTNASEPALINNLIGSARLVSSNFQGSDKEALMSLLKVAYAQAWQQVGAQPVP
jgi:hypothetical protein